MNKIKILIILLLVLVIGIGAGTYCAFTNYVEKSGTIQVNELSTKLLNNSDFIIKLQQLDNTIISVNKETDLVKVETIPNINLSNNNIVSTSDSNVPTYLWIDNSVIYYYTIATSIDLNNQ